MTWSLKDWISQKAALGASASRDKEPGARFPFLLLATVSVSAALVLGCGGGVTRLVPTAAEAKCQDLAHRAFSGAKLLKVSHHPASTFTTPSNAAIPNVPAFCQVSASLQPSADSDIRVEVWLPAEGWNGKYLGLGNGGYGGSLNYSALSQGLARKYAVAHTDMGTAPSTSRDGSPLLNHPEKWVDWGYRSTHLMTLFAKEVSSMYYARVPSKSYFMGCSTGGGQGIHEAVRFPDDYDGIIAGAPGSNRLGAHQSVLWSWASSKASPESALPAAKLTLLADSVMAACDSLDGVSDKIISRPERCTFNPKVLQCSGADDASCLTTSQVSTVNAIYAGPRNRLTGELIFQGPLPGSEASWGMYVGAAPPEALVPFGAIFHWVFGKEWDWRTFDWGQDVITMERTIGQMVSAVNPDVRAFRDRGGKLISFQGLADSLKPPNDMERYLHNVEVVTGQSSSFVRLFNAPGMGHCSGGSAPNAFGNDLTSGSVAPGDPTRDLLTALEHWVEKGVAPDRIVATQFSGSDLSTRTIVRTRPLCAAPKIARYNGSGDTNIESSFTCSAAD
ncbi:tannase/feruloyl esterase family alpha/beta hydrolase [Acidovorax sp. D2M1]|uniref:Tannase/feruloyl esterase family alpha/beta hydrolase n=1 Tax=Acidovorax benzenivorans TaxID=2987520 RepID=A0ABT5S3L3_9BURK|nr:tannase/feruloyl esterase family alpha/beta hydrolase [Acidovorax benzenivorans]MDD2180541.1 tannase/feruloyl esterase family alpha/beta hydrolase [Acidovorax benzenivorans]